MYIKLPRRCSLLKCLLAVVLLCSCVPLYYSLFFLSSSPPTDYANAFVALDMESTKHEQFDSAIGESKGLLPNRVLESTLVTAESVVDKDPTATKFHLKIDSTRHDTNSSKGPNLSLQDHTGHPPSENLSRSKDFHDSTSLDIGDTDRNHESNLKNLKYSLSDIDKRGEIHPRLDLKHKYTFPDRVKYFMLRYFEKKRFSDWYRSKMTQDISPSFTSYVQFLSYVYSQQGMHLNEHLALSTTLCQPCVFNYTFHANFKYLPEDATRVMDKFDIPHHYYRDVENHPVYTTRELVQFFFEDMSQEKRSQSLKDLERRVGRRIEGIPSTNLQQSLMQDLFTALEVEFDFYYSLYPEEKNSHLRFLNF